MSRKRAKARDFAFILYPESLPSDWEIKLKELGIPMAISPLHNMDKLEEKKYTEEDKSRAQAGEEIFKKEHYHVIYTGKNPVTTESVRNKIKRTLGDQTISNVQIIDNVNNYYEYLTHESESAIAKNKYVYDREEIKLLNGFDIKDFQELSEKEKKNLMKKMVIVIREEKIPNAYELHLHLLENPIAKNLEEIDSEVEYYEHEDVMEMISNNPSYFRIWFDGVYQYRQRKYDIEKTKMMEEFFGKD